MTSETQDKDGLVERLRTPVDGDAIYDHIIKLRKLTRSDLPRLSLVGKFEHLDAERAEAAARIEAQAAQIEQMREALEAAERTFRKYTAMHATKGTADGDAKALRNRVMADRCAQVLDQVGKGAA